MKEAVAVASIAILFGMADANANNAPTDQNILQVAQNASTGQATRLHPVTGKRLHPVTGKRLHPVTGKRLHPVTGKRLHPVTGKRLHPVTGKRLHPVTG
jgi:hypothetical protein